MSHEVVSNRDEPASTTSAPRGEPPDERPVSLAARSRGLKIRHMLLGLSPTPSTLRWVTSSHRPAALRRNTGRTVLSVTDLSARAPSKTFKRTFDLLGATAGIILLFPLLALIAVVIKANSQGPVIFRQMRYGEDGKLFEIYKFRTMYVDKCDHSGVRQTIANDPRVTAVGDFLRRSNFDELPQLFNVLRGEMSLVGPRPHVPGMLAAGIPYEDFDQRYMDRHKVKPGLTGLAQVNGCRGETKDRRAAQVRLEYDLSYIEQQSVRLDVKIIYETVVKEFFKGNGY